MNNNNPTSHCVHDAKSMCNPFPPTIAEMPSMHVDFMSYTQWDPTMLKIDVVLQISVFPFNINITIQLCNFIDFELSIYMNMYIVHVRKREQVMQIILR